MGQDPTLSFPAILMGDVRHPQIKDEHCHMRMILGSWLDPKRLNDGQRAITAAGSCEPWCCWKPRTKQSFGYAIRASLTLTFPTRWNACFFTFLRNLPGTVQRLRRAAGSSHSTSANLPFFYLDTAGDSPDCAGGGVAVQDCTGSGTFSSLVSLSSSVPASWL